MPQRIANGLPQTRSGGDPPGVFLKPDMQGLHDRPTSLVPDPLSVVVGMSADLGTQCSACVNTLQHLGSERRLGRGVTGGEVLSGMAPAKCQRDRSVAGGYVQALEPGIAVDL